MGIEEVFIDHCPGCEHVVPGIVTPGGPPSPPLTRRWGGIRKKIIKKDNKVLWNSKHYESQHSYYLVSISIATYSVIQHWRISQDFCESCISNLIRVHRRTDKLYGYGINDICALLRRQGKTREHENPGVMCEHFRTWTTHLCDDQIFWVLCCWHDIRWCRA